MDSTLSVRETKRSLSDRLDRYLRLFEASFQNRGPSGSGATPGRRAGLLGAIERDAQRVRDAAIGALLHAGGLAASLDSAGAGADAPHGVSDGGEKPRPATWKGEPDGALGGAGPLDETQEDGGRATVKKALPNL